MGYQPKKRDPGRYPPGYQGRPGYWEDEVRKLYARSPDMEVAELEALLEVAVRDERPDHPGLPLCWDGRFSVGGMPLPPRPVPLRQVHA